MKVVTTLTEQSLKDDSPEARESWALVILWSAQQPARVGEIGLLPATSEHFVLGRAPQKGGAAETAGEPIRFFRQRPPGCPDAQESADGVAELEGAHISRRQLRFRLRGDVLLMQRIGQCAVLVNGQRTESCELRAGDVIHVSEQLLLLCQRRPARLPALRHYPVAHLGAFGEPDRDGMVGESVGMWKLRDRIAAFAKTQHHVLLIGESGSGKELAAQALHRLSARAERRLVADNVSTLPPGLAAAILFGNRKNFPNVGMEERAGLIGAAHGSTLFLDEIGDMPEPVQPMFLRVAERGEYMRLGEEGRVQRADFRLIGATNRPEQLRYELKRRFAREIRIPGLPQRREDVPLLVNHMLRDLARQDDPEAARFLTGRYPRVSPFLVEQLVLHGYRTHVSEIAFILGKAMADAESSVLLPRGSSAGPAPLLGEPRAVSVRVNEQTPERFPENLAEHLTERFTERAKEPAGARLPEPRPLPTPAVAQQMLDRCDGNIRRAATALDISRDQLNRLISRERLAVRRPLGTN